jgi:OOP family OmpA-OmpF porin
MTGGRTMKRWRWAIAAGLGVSFAVGNAVAGDVPNSADHPLMSRYPGSEIEDYSQHAFDQTTIVLGKPEDEQPFKSQQLEGKLTRIGYVNPEGRSALEIFRNYQLALKRGGFVTLYSCDGEGQCGGNHVVGWCGGCSPHHLTARLQRPEGDVYVSVHVEQDSPNNAAHVKLEVMEVKPMEEGLVTVDADALSKDIARTGHASVYGVYFDTGKADVKPESDAALKEIAKLLRQDSKLKLYVVGHTDNQGSLESNLDLSRRRADAVVKVLVSRHSVAAARLKPAGDGPTAPVASNDSEQGRAKNRRVELVKQ